MPDIMDEARSFKRGILDTHETEYTLCKVIDTK